MISSRCITISTSRALHPNRFLSEHHHSQHIVVMSRFSPFNICGNNLLLWIFSYEVIFSSFGTYQPYWEDWNSCVIINHEVYRSDNSTAMYGFCRHNNNINSVKSSKEYWENKTNPSCRKAVTSCRDISLLVGSVLRMPRGNGGGTVIWCSWRWKRKGCEEWILECLWASCDRDPPLSRLCLLRKKRTYKHKDSVCVNNQNPEHTEIPIDSYRLSSTLSSLYSIDRMCLRMKIRD